MKSNRIFLSPPHIGDLEQQFVEDAFNSNYIAPLGPQTDAFEEEFSEYTGIEHCVALSSGTAAMHLALQGLGVGAGDEVIGSSLTFIGSISPVIFLGASLVFVDCDFESWNMDPDLLAEELKAGKMRGKLPKAVIPTDLYGQCADYDRIFNICDSYGVPVVVDAAEAMGATYAGNGMSGLEPKQAVHAGKGARAAVFSFNGNKIMTTSGGGMLASDDKDLIDRARFLSQQAREPFSYYEHSEIGYNYRMSNVLAGIGRGQLKVLDERVRRKREIFKYYQRALKHVPGVKFMPEASYGKCNRWLTVIFINPEDFGVEYKSVRGALENENIESRPVWKPMHLQPVFDCGVEEGIINSIHPMKKRYKARMVGGSVSEELFAHGLCLPSGTAMTDHDMDRVIEIILKCRT